MWREISGLRTLLAAAGAAFFYFGASRSVQAQELPEHFVIELEQLAQEDGEAEAADRQELYLHFLEHPMQINRLSSRQLRSSGLLNPFQAEAIIAWRRDSGDILSIAELALVEGFGADEARRLAPLLSFVTDSPAGMRRDSLERVSTELRARARYSFGQEGLYAYTRYSGGYGDNWSWGVTAEQDRSEPLAGGWRPDFLSAGVAYDGPGKVGFVAGDFRAKFGQGLVLSKNFPVSFISGASSLVRNPSGLSRYTSTDEYNFLRGAGVSVEVGRGWAVTALASANTVDANISGSTYTSISTAGYHDTPTLIARRRNMHEYLGAVNVSRQGLRTRFGMTAAVYGYDRHNARRVQEYNRYQMYDGAWGNVGVDFYTVLGNVRFFGEAAVDAHFAPALLLGAIWRPEYGFEAGLLLRSYSYKYIASHAGAYSSLSSCSNQQGVALCLTWMPSQRWKVTATADAVYHPHDRFRVASPSAVVKPSLQAELSAGRLSFLAKVAGNWQSVAEAMKVTGSIGAGFGITERLTVSARVSGVRADDRSLGGAAYVQLKYSARIFDISLRGTAHRTDGWNSRVYLYEQDLPGSFGVTALSGEGCGAYLYTSVKFSRHLKLHLKASAKAASIQIEWK